jgi:hypothetical protein
MMVTKKHGDFGHHKAVVGTQTFFRIVGDDADE